MDKYFVCLANSYKRGGRCIAGVEIISDNNGGWMPARNEDGRPRWIRPIARTTYGEIPNYIAEDIATLSLVKLTDVVLCPEEAHVENVSYSRMGKCNYEIASEPSIMNNFIDTVHQSIFQSKGRAVSAEMLNGIHYSLMLIHPNRACAYIDENREKSKNRMKFSYYGTEYDFPITDPTFIERLKQNPEGYLSIYDVYLTISLGLEFEGWHHKLVAGVIMPNTTELPKEIKPDWFDEYEQELARLMDKKNEIEGQINEVRANILQQMESHGIEKIRSEQFSVSYTPARTVVQFDSKAFRTENEELYSNYCRPKLREASIVVKRNVKE